MNYWWFTDEIKNKQIKDSLKDYIPYVCGATKVFQEQIFKEIGISRQTYNIVEI